MAVVVLVLWFFTAGAGFYLLVTSNLRGTQSVPTTLIPQSASAARAAAIVQSATAARAATAVQPATVAHSAQPHPAAPSDLTVPSAGRSSHRGPSRRVSAA
jgi:nucleoid-associated protein YgaU